MHVLNIFLIFNFVIIITNTKIIEFCLKNFKEICYPCYNNEYNCNTIVNKKMIVTNITNLDYESYLSTNIKIIVNSKLITIYSCLNSINYIQVNAYDYYPIQKYESILRSLDKQENMSQSANELFQSCLEAHCSMEEHSFKCYHSGIKNYNFTFTSIVTFQCIQNITYVHITNEHISKIDDNNNFFKFALNIIYIKLEFANLNSFSCNVFVDLQNLRVINIHFDNFIKLKYFKCLFNTNPNLIHININEKWIWNDCNYTNNKNSIEEYKELNDNNQPSLFIALYFILFESLVVAGFIYWHFRQASNFTNSNTTDQDI